MKDCELQEFLALIYHQCFRWDTQMIKMSHHLYRFLHKHPEDPAEVPNGFLTDINPVSSSVGHIWNTEDV